MTSSGNGGADTFSFRAGEAGDDLIVVFNPGIDIVELTGSAANVDPLAKLRADARGTVLDLGGGDDEPAAPRSGSALRFAPLVRERGEGVERGRVRARQMT